MVFRSLLGCVVPTWLMRGQLPSPWACACLALEMYRLDLDGVASILAGRLEADCLWLGSGDARGRVMCLTCDRYWSSTIQDVNCKNMPRGGLLVMFDKNRFT
jgi:hypothetical protein